VREMKKIDFTELALHFAVLLFTAWAVISINILINL
jgi:hypothetical protein